MASLNLLYIGNKLSAHGANTTGIEMLGPLLAQNGYVVRYASDKKNKLSRLLDMVWKTISLRQTTDYVLIDTYSTVNFWYAVAVSQLCRLFGLKYIPILHGGDLPNRLRRNPKLCRLVFSHAHVNVAPSGYLWEAFRNAGFQTLKIPNAIDTAHYVFTERKKLKPKLLWVRSFSDLYNPQMAVKVLHEVKKQFPDAELCMVGPDKNGNLEKTRQLAESLGVSVEFTGKLSKADWLKLSEAYDIFINTTHYDNMPVSVIEAMALGIPVVSTNVGGLPFLLEHGKTALFVADNDTDEMAKCVINLINDQEIKSKIVQNAFLLTREFDTQKVQSAWLEILR
ncbi:glycosyltransferase family 4 protein [Flavobacterium sp.]|uniref:glycosyltransferase family 4 protein n=1 Tax=Flavobacterium sp. TaxID=239 RepID=UPI0039E3F1D1